MNFKKIILLSTMITLLLLLFCINVNANQVSCGGETYYEKENNILYVRGNGAMEFLEITTPLGITEVVVEEGITEICNYAFMNFTDLAKVTLPTSLKKIGAYAFESCNNITDISIPENVEEIKSGAFSRTGISNIVFNDKIDTIQSNTFYKCSNLTEIIITDNIITIEESAFEECTSVKKIVIGKNVENIEFYAFANAKSLETLIWNTNKTGDIKRSNKIFKNAGTSGDGIIVTFDNSVTHIPSNIFYPQIDNFNHIKNSYAPKIISVAMPASLKTIGENAFYSCTTLTEISIPNGVTSIDDCAFAKTGLKTVFIPENVSSIGNNAFECCESLTTITVDDNNKKYCDENGVLLDINKTILMQYPSGNIATDFTVPDTVEKLCEHCFCDSINLITINLPANLKSIGGAAFMNCYNLSKLELPENLTDMSGGSTFYNCSSLESINLPRNITQIPSYTFYGCESLKVFPIHNYVTKIGQSAYSKCKSLTEIIVPDSVLDIYQSAFSDCRKLTKIILPKHITTIDSYTFSYCTKLKEIVIPDEVIEIKQQAFHICSSLSTVTLPRSLETIGSSAFSDTNVINLLYKGTFDDWKALKEAISSGNDDLTSGSIYCNYYEGKDFIAFYVNDEGTIILTAINCETENSYFYLLIYDEDNNLVKILINEPSDKQVKYFKTDFYYDLTKGKATAFLWDKTSLSPLTEAVTKNYNFKEEDSAEDVVIGGGGSGGNSGGSAIGGVVVGGDVAGSN